MDKWSLPRLLADLHTSIQQKLEIARGAFAHGGTKGGATEHVWRELFETYLPLRYRALSGHVVDSQGAFSDQLDLVIADRQYSPFIFSFQGASIVPAESVYAVFEIKQSLNATSVKYAQDKIASARRLHRTSLPIPHAGGEYPPKVPNRILGGLLCLESDWTPGLGTPLLEALDRGAPEGKLDLGCVAAHGGFAPGPDGHYAISSSRPATTFLFELIARLQACATVPMLDVRAYARWLAS